MKSFPPIVCASALFSDAASAAPRPRSATASAGLCATALALSGCFDIDIATRIDASTVESTMTFTMSPQAHDLMGETDDPCDTEWRFDGTNYICETRISGTLDDATSPDTVMPPLFDLTREGDQRVRVTLNLDGDTMADPDADPEMIAMIFAGNAMTFRFSAATVIEQSGGTIIDDGSTVIWRIPLTWLMSDDERLRAPRTALLEF